MLFIWYPSICSAVLLRGRLPPARASLCPPEHLVVFATTFTTRQPGKQTLLFSLTTLFFDCACNIIGFPNSNKHFVFCDCFLRTYLLSKHFCFLSFETSFICSTRTNFKKLTLKDLNSSSKTKTLRLPPRRQRKLNQLTHVANKKIIVIKLIYEKFQFGILDYYIILSPKLTFLTSIRL